MAFAFGDSYLKLPPISQEDSVEIDGEDSKRNLGIVRDKHGLVRLPPIVRLDSLRSTSTAQRFRNETPTAVSSEKTEVAMSRSPMKITDKMGSLRLQGRSKKLKKYDNKSEDEMKLIMEAAVKETNEDETSFFDSENVSHEKERASCQRLGSSSALLSLTGNGELLPAHKDSILSRRGSNTFQPTKKLTRSRRLVKSSPELSNRKKNMRLLADGNISEHSLSSLAAGSMPVVRSDPSSRPQLAVQDIDGSKLSQVQNYAKIEEKAKEYGGKRRNHSNQRWKIDVANLPQSTPSSPVCSESANSEIKQKGRKSLNDITDAEQFVDRRRPSLKKQNLVYDADVDVLKIEGKKCSQSEIKLQRGDALTECNVEMLDLPRNEEKRHSLYDLQQILTLLQKEDLKRQASNTASSSRNASATSNASGREPSESVYDLREFLLMAAAEASSAGQLKKTQTNKLSANNSQTSSSSHLAPPGREKDGRKGSVYDLMEFLTLGNSSETGSGSTSENSSRSTSPRILSSPHASSSSNNLLSVSVANSGEESRRASTYDLMEFLSLPRSGGNSRPDSGPSSPALHEEGSSAAESKMSDSGTEKVKEKRSLSMYDLEEFLSMTSDIPPLVRVTPWEEEQKTNSSKTISDSEEGAKRDLQQPRGSVYDLSEILSVLQQENEKRHESASNLRQMLFHFQREAEKTGQSSLTQSTNLPAKCTVGSSPVTPTIDNSGYSTGSDQVASTDAPKNMDVTENSRHMSVYDLREFLSLYAAQQNPSATHQQQLSSAVSLRRKFSGVSQSGVSILVTDESNRSIDSEFYEDVFLPVPSTEPSGASDPSRKRSSIYDLREFLSILNADESPLRRRLSSVSSASSKSSESESESNSAKTTGPLKPAGPSHGRENSSRPQLFPRQDSGGSLSLYDLGEFLSLLNTEESPLRRRLSSVNDKISAQGEEGARTPVLSRSDSEKGLYSLEEILTVMNELEQRNSCENMSGDIEGNVGEEISIQVPTLPPKADTTNTQSLPTRKLLQPQRSLKSVPETSEVKNTHSNSL